MLPTTGAQVSGHRFLLRRIEHGLVLGDIRMIHDPLGARRRALFFGLTALVLISLGAGLLAWLRPAQDPGEALILQGGSGALYVRVDDLVHPVTNLASARLITGSADDPARIGDDLLADLPRGVPLGIPGAPGLLAAAPPEEAGWAVCQDGAGVTVSAGAVPELLGGHRAVLAVGAGREWLLTAQGRAVLPGEDSPEGRVLRRALGVTDQTPRWEPPPEVLAVVVELAPVRAPVPLPEELLVTGGGDWVFDGGRVAAVSAWHGGIFADLGVPVRQVPRAEIAGLPGGVDPERLGVDLPDRAPVWVDPGAESVCATGVGGAGVWSELPAGAVALSGEAVADRFVGLPAGAVAVDTGHGLHVVSATGVRHGVPDAAAVGALGLPEPVVAPWSVLRLLPEGAELSVEAARRATY